MSTPPSYGSQPGGGQYPGQAPNPYAGTPAQQQPNPYAAAPAGAPAGAQPQVPGQQQIPGQQQAYPAPPYGQPQPGQQQPYPPQQPYPNQQPFPGQPPYPGQPQQGGGWQVPPPSKPSRTSRFSSKLAIRLGVLVVLGVAAFAWSQFDGDPSTAKVGDCVQNKGTSSNPDVHVIKCSDPKAAYKVLKTADGDDDSVCDSVAGTVVTFTETGSKDLVLCLGDNKPTG